MTWDLGKWIGVIRPFGFLIGKTFRLSEAEEEEYRGVTTKNKQADELNDEIEKLEKYLATKDYKGGDGTARFGRTKEEMERDLQIAKQRQ